MYVLYCYLSCFPFLSLFIVFFSSSSVAASRKSWLGASSSHDFFLSVLDSPFRFPFTYCYICYLSLLLLPLPSQLAIRKSWMAPLSLSLFTSTTVLHNWDFIPLHTNIVSRELTPFHHSRAFILLTGKSFTEVTWDCTKHAVTCFSSKNTLFEEPGRSATEFHLPVGSSLLGT